MSFNVHLINNHSPANYVNKYLESLQILVGTLRDQSSIIDPVITIKSTTVPSCNYAYIPTFKRYYYVNNIVSVTTEIWELSMHVDVLESYKEQIRANSAIVSRQEKQYNMMLDDGWFQCYQDPYYRVQTFSEEKPFESQSFVLVVAGSSA